MKCKTNMKCKSKKLEELCTIKTGASASRAKDVPDGVTPRKVKVLLSRAMQSGAIIDEELVEEYVGEVKEENFTRLDDVVIKLSTPYDCVRIDADHEGIMVTSFGMILRKKDPEAVNMQYLSMFLNSSHANEIMAAVSTGQTSTMAILKRKTVAALDVPLPSKEKQALLARLYEGVQERRKGYQRLMALDEELLNSQLTKAIWGE